METGAMRDDVKEKHEELIHYQDELVVYQVKFNSSGFHDSVNTEVVLCVGRIGREFQ